MFSAKAKIRKTFGFPRSRARSHGALPLVYASHINRQNSMLTFAFAENILSINVDACFVPRVFVHATTLIPRIRSS